MTTVRDLATRTEEHDDPTPGPDESFGGYTVMGLPFPNGHYLAFRRLPANPFGRPYSSVWHRDPAGAWTFFVDAPADESCPRFFDAGIRASVRTPIDVSWPGPSHLRVEVPGTLTWDLEFGSTAATAALSAAARATPARLMRSGAVLALMGRMAGPMLRTGRMRMAGTTPNGQWFRAEPTRLWSVVSSTAVLDGTDLGTPGPLPEQAHLADLWLPQRGVMMLGAGVFEAFDRARHRSARPAVTDAGLLPRTRVAS